MDKSPSLWYPSSMFRFYWQDGSTEDVPGSTIEEAFQNSGYSLLSLALMEAYEDITITNDAHS